MKSPEYNAIELRKIALSLKRVNAPQSNIQLISEASYQLQVLDAIHTELLENGNDEMIIRAIRKVAACGAYAISEQKPPFTTGPHGGLPFDPQRN